MPITAPRFTPTGNLPSAMPTPQASGANGLASGLASIGESLASLGKSAEYAKAVQERRDAMAKASVEAAANDAFVQWDLDTKEGYGKFKTEAVGAQTMNRRSAFGEHLQRDTSSYTKDLSPEAAAEFDKRVQIARRTNSIAADEIAANRHGVWVIQTQSVALEQAMDSAAVARVAQDDAGYTAAFDQVVKAIDSRAAYTGEAWDYAMLKDGVEYSALRKIVASKEYASASEFHAKSKFGAFQNQADELMKPVEDKIWADDTAAQMGAAYRVYGLTGQDGDGSQPPASPNAYVFDADGAMRYADTLNVSQERKSQLMDNIEKMRKADEVRRKEMGANMLQSLEVAQMTTPTHAAAMYDSPAFQAQMEVLPNEQRSAIMQRNSQGASYSNPWDMAIAKSNAMTMDDAEWNAFMEEGRGTMVLNEPDRSKLDAIRKNRMGDVGKNVMRAVESYFSEGGTKAVPKADGKDLRGDALKSRQAINAVSEAIEQELRVNKEKQKEYSLAPDKTAWLETEVAIWTSNFRKTVGNGIFSPKQTIEALASAGAPLTTDEDTPTLRAAAQVPAQGPLSPSQRLTVRATILQQRAAKAVADDAADDGWDSLWQGGGTTKGSVDDPSRFDMYQQWSNPNPP